MQITIVLDREDITAESSTLLAQFLASVPVKAVRNKRAPKATTKAPEAQPLQDVPLVITQPKPLADKTTVLVGKTPLAANGAAPMPPAINDEAAPTRPNANGAAPTDVLSNPFSEAAPDPVVDAAPAPTTAAPVPTGAAAVDALFNVGEAAPHPVVAPAPDPVVAPAPAATTQPTLIDMQNLAREALRKIAQTQGRGVAEAAMRKYAPSADQLTAEHCTALLTA